MGVVISIYASPDVGLEDIDVASTMIANECSEDANVIFGVAFDPELEDEMRITIVATGFQKDEEKDAPVARGPVAAPEAAKAPEKKKSGEFSLDDFFGDNVL